VWTPLVGKQTGDQARARGITEERAVKDVLLKEQPTGRFAAVEEIGALAVFLCTEAALAVDGGCMGYPVIYPLIYHCGSRDVPVVHINPMERRQLPATATEIMNRINEISFNSSLMREMRAIAFVTDLVDQGKVADGSLKRMSIHPISAGDVMRGLSVMSKLNAGWEFLHHLMEHGREHAGRWLEQCLDRGGRASTIDVRQIYL